MIVGVDEIQLLNDTKKLGSGRNELGLGSLFLRFLRQWQVDLISKNILIVPIVSTTAEYDIMMDVFASSTSLTSDVYFAPGTGITLDFSFDHTTGTNLVLPKGVEAGEDDTILISKVDFRALASLRYEKFKEGPRGFNVQYGNAKETVLDKVTALWWPRVRPIEEWKPFRMPQLYGLALIVEPGRSGCVGGCWTSRSPLPLILYIFQGMNLTAWLVVSTPFSFSKILLRTK